MPNTRYFKNKKNLFLFLVLAFFSLPLFSHAQATCTDNASVTSTTLPATLNLITGQSYPFNLTIQNSGTSYWYNGSGYSLVQPGYYWEWPSAGSQGLAPVQVLTNFPPCNAGANATIYGHICPGIRPGQTITWGFDLRAPSAPGRYTFEMSMMHVQGWSYRNTSGAVCSGAALPNPNNYFGQRLTSTITVTAPPATPTPTPPPVTPTPTPPPPTPTPPPVTPTPTLPPPTQPPAPTILAPPPPPGPQSGNPQSFRWDLRNPLRGLNNGTPPDDIFGALLLITDWILNIAGSLIVALVIYAGVRFVISRGNPGEIQKAKSILWWALVGYAIILVGKGFIFIVDSVLRGDIPTFI